MDFRIIRTLISWLVAGLSAYFLFDSFGSLVMRLSANGMPAPVYFTQAVFTLAWTIGVAFILVHLADYFAFRRAKYWLRKLAVIDADKTRHIRFYHWALVNFDMWKFRADKCLDDFSSKGRTVTSMSDLISLYQ